MAGNDNRNRIAIIGHAYGAESLGPADGASDVGIEHTRLPIEMRLRARLTP